MPILAVILEKSIFEKDMLSGQWLTPVIPGLRRPKKECCPKLEAILRTEILMRGGQKWRRQEGKEEDLA